jgi:tRNA (guanine-N7-)-methyltransferase
MNGRALRRIRSFVRREGRMTHAQREALRTLWPRFGVDYAPALLDPDALFARHAPRVIEIGFGMGQSLAQMAQARPDTDFLGIEVHRPGVGNLLNLIERHHLCNVRILCHDAVEVLQHCIPDDSIDCVQLFFPDPWPKKRHHKRRLVQSDFVELIRRKLRPGGILHLATDWQDYAEHMLGVMRQATGFTNLSARGEFMPRPAYRPLTKFEQRGQRLGHGVWDLMFRRSA